MDIVWKQTETEEKFKIFLNQNLLSQQLIEMHQQFLASASAQLNYMTTDELREIFKDDDKLDERIDEIV